MKRICYIGFLLVASVFCGGASQQFLVGYPAGGTGHGTVNFTTPGPTSWTVPAGVTSITVKCWGAGGARSYGARTEYGGGGAYATASYTVVPGATVKIWVGRDIGSQRGGQGSMAADGSGTYNWFVVAGGGGDSAISANNGSYGGYGGATTGDAGGNDGGGNATGGGGGFSSGGGAAGTGTGGDGSPGDGPASITYGPNNTSGGGGYYSGGTGGYDTSYNQAGSGGGCSFYDTNAGHNYIGGGSSTSGTDGELGLNAANRSDANYISDHGNGGQADVTSGQPGLVVIIY